jgi:hypothetical protein
MGTARFETVMDYARREVDVAIRCEGCRRVRNMTADQLGAVFGLDGKRLAIERRLRCSQCGHKGAKLAPIPKLEG